jgi:hypothetical protein
VWYDCLGGDGLKEIVWMIIDPLIYFFDGIKYSKLRKKP